jgi:hypothetical protein
MWSVNMQNILNVITLSGIILSVIMLSAINNRNFKFQITQPRYD